MDKRESMSAVVLAVLTVLITVLLIIVANHNSQPVDGDDREMRIFQVTYLDGYSENITYNLLRESEVFVRTRRGSYYLTLIEPCGWRGRARCSTILKVGVIRVKELQNA